MEEVTPGVLSRSRGVFAGITARREPAPWEKEQQGVGKASASRCSGGSAGMTDATTLSKGSGSPSKRWLTKHGSCLIQQRVRFFRRGQLA